MTFDAASVTANELKDGFTLNAQTGIYQCLFCDAAFEQGMIYPIGERFADAHKVIRMHIESEHGSVFSMLLSADKRATGLTDTQKEVLASFYGGLSDKEIAKVTNTSPSTIRYQRFSFREKAKQAKVVLVLSELLEEKRKQKDDTLLEIHPSATMVDERYLVTDAEADKILRTFFETMTPPILKHFPAKEKAKLVVLRVFAREFSPAVKYTEKQINEIIAAIYPDFATIRRYLIDYGFLDRTTDCSEYWMK